MRRRQILAAAKVVPHNGKYVVYASPEFVKFAQDVVAEADKTPAPVKKKRGPRRKKETT